MRKLRLIFNLLFTKDFIVVLFGEENIKFGGSISKDNNAEIKPILAKIEEIFHNCLTTQALLNKEYNDEV